MQGKTVVYTVSMLQPKFPGSADQQDHYNLHLESSMSHDLIRWLCAILAPEPGWVAKGGGSAPWAAFCSGVNRLNITSDKPITFGRVERPPNSALAMELFIELCSIYGLEYSPRGAGPGPLSPIPAAFLAALSLPFYRECGLIPRFPTSSLNPSKIPKDGIEPIQQTFSDLPYYMTLSMHPRSVGSIIWSIFWDPTIACNLVSPWLASIHSVVKPLIDAGNVDILAKIFTQRRPRVALWWIGIFLLGDPTILDFITRYLQTTEERWGYASMAPPDVIVCSWTASPQSFLDEDCSQLYTRMDDVIARADLLRIRSNLLLRNTDSIPLSWKPFGTIPKPQIELEAWPWLEEGCKRSYVCWTWWVEDDSGLRRKQIACGFHMDTGRFIQDIPDRLGRTGLQYIDECSEVVKLAPSRLSTLRMVHYCMGDIAGDRDTGLSTLPGAQDHPWLKHWRGLE